MKFLGICPAYNKHRTLSRRNDEVLTKFLVYSFGFIPFIMTYKELFYAYFEIFL